MRPSAPSGKGRPCACPADTRGTRCGARDRVHCKPLVGPSGWDRMVVSLARQALSELVG